jgi:hypothetical protein
LTSGTSGSTRAWRDARGGDLWGLTAFTPHTLRGETGKGQNGVWAAKTSDLEQRMANVHTHAGEESELVHWLGFLSRESDRVGDTTKVLLGTPVVKSEVKWRGGA